MQARLKQLGLTPAKGALVAGLVLLLAVIWGPQFITGGGSAAPSSKATASRSPGKAARRSSRRPVRSTAKKNAALSTATGSTSSYKREIPIIGASEAGVYDPFRVPSWSPAAAMVVQRSPSQEKTDSFLTKEEIETRATLLREAGVAMVLVSSTGQIARIGDQTVQVGDEIKGFLVTKITAEGVVLQPNTSGPINEEDRDDSSSSF